MERRNLSELVDAHGLEAVARAIGRTPAYVRQVVAGHHPVSGPLIGALIRAYGSEFDDRAAWRERWGPEEAEEASR
ncbi:MAG: hypothetical protein PVJ64_00415 [Gemmatimonadales bacterium]|jgi:hypothetical protein